MSWDAWGGVCVFWGGGGAESLGSVYDKIADPAFLTAANAKGEGLRAGLQTALSLKGNSHVKEVCEWVHTGVCVCEGRGGGSSLVCVPGLMA